MGVPLWSYPLTQFQAVTRYLQLGLWPHPRVFECGTFRVERAGEVIPFAAVVGPLLAGTAYALRKKPALGFAGTCCRGILAPASLAPGTTQMVVEHQIYLPLAAVVVLGAHRLLGRQALAWGTVVAAACGIGKARRNYDYRSQLARWTKTVEQHPENPRARQGLAAASAELGRLDEAIEQPSEAVRLRPDDSTYRYNLARGLAHANRLDATMLHYRHALRLATTEARAHHNLAIALGCAGRGAAGLPH
jgi:tetratricopeptide (TPR) repeat protein